MSRIHDAMLPKANRSVSTIGREGLRVGLLFNFTRMKKVRKAAETRRIGMPRYLARYRHLRFGHSVLVSILHA